MGKFAGGFLRTFTTLLYVLAFMTTAICLGIFSYFLSKLSVHHLPIATRWRAVEGLSGAAVLYTIFAVLLTCFLGGFAAFGVLGIILDILFCGAMIAVAILTRHGANSCKGVVNTPLGVGNGNVQRAGTHLHYACKLNTTVFACSLIAALLFALAAIFQFFLLLNHKKEKKYGPSPKNNYTSGSGRRNLFKRKPKTTKDAYGEGNGTYTNGNTAELGSVNGTNHHSVNGRPSAETGYTGTTAARDSYQTPATKYEQPHGGFNSKTAGTGNYVTPATGNAPPTGGYTHTADVNPYGYNNAHPTGTAVNY